MAQAGNPELSRKEERAVEKAAVEARKKAAVDAWNILDAQEKEAEAEVAALNAISPRNATQELALKENQDEIRELKKQKAAVEEAWVKEFKCPFDRLYRDIENPAAKARTEALIEDVNKPGTKEQIQALRVDFVTYQQQQLTSAYAAQCLLEAELMPSDLKGGPDVARAARAVLPKHLAEEFAERLKVPGSPEYEAAIAELTPFADALQPVYEDIAKLKAAAKDLEKGVIVGRTMDAIKEVAGNPAKIGGAALGLLGAWALFSTFSAPGDGTTTWFKRIFGLVGLGVGVGVVSGALNFKNIGLGDAVESVAGMRGDEAFSTDAMKQVRHLFEGMPTADTDAVDDFIRVVDAPVEKVAAIFTDALRTPGATEVETSRLLNDGLSSKEHKMVDAGSLYTACRWFFMEAYEKALGKGEVNPESNEDAKCKAGVDWVLKNCKGHQMGTAIVALELVRMGSSSASAAPTSGVEIASSAPGLNELSKVSPDFKEALRRTNTAGIYRVKGYPYKYQLTEAGTHLFTDLLDPTKVVTIGKDLTGTALSGTVDQFVVDAEKLARAKYAAIAGVAPTAIKYNALGHWELEPPLERVAHQGLPHYLRGPNDAKVPVILYPDILAKVLRIEKDGNQDGVPDPHNVPYTSVNDVAMDFERGILEDRVKKDISSTMLIPFTVETGEWEEIPGPPAQTKVTIRYEGTTGTVIYENDAIKSFSLAANGKLEAAWTAAANVKREQFLGEPRVQAALLRATTSYTGYNPSKIGGLVEKFIGLTKDGYEWVTNDGLTNKFEYEWEKQVIREMTKLIYDPVNGFSKLYVDALFKSGTDDHQFQAKEATFMNAQVTSLEGSGVLMAPVTPLKEPDMPVEWADLTRIINEKGQDRVALALSPLKYEKPTASTSFSWTLVNGVYNFAMGDATREHEADQIIKDYMQELATNIRGRATPPAKVTMHQIEEEIEKIEYKAQGEALTYWNTNDQAAVEKMMLSPIKNQPAYAQWEGATKTVASYLANSLKWENYGFMPNPENMAEIMKVWYERIGNAATPPVNAGSIDTADQYAKYFIWETWARFGGNKDYSLDALYSGKIESVSDSQFKAEVTGFKSAVQPYTVWLVTASSNVRPAVPGMESSLDKYKETEKKAFEEWFDTYAAVPVWDKPARYGPQMFKWNQIFKESAMARFGHFEQSGTTISGMADNVKELKRFVMVEKYIVYETLVMEGLEPEHWGNDIDRNVIKDFWSQFYHAPLIPPITGQKDLKPYMGYLKKNMAIQLNEFHRQPNWPGIPFI